MPPNNIGTQKAPSIYSCYKITFHASQNYLHTVHLCIYSWIGVLTYFSVTCEWASAHCYPQKLPAPVYPEAHTMTLQSLLQKTEQPSPRARLSVGDTELPSEEGRSSLKIHSRSATGPSPGATLPMETPFLPAATLLTSFFKPLAVQSGREAERNTWSLRLGAIGG